MSTRRTPMEFRRELSEQDANRIQRLCQDLYNPHQESEIQSRMDLIEIGQVLYMMLIPDDLRVLLRQNTLPLSIYGGEPFVPWELLHDGEEFLGLRFPLGRLPSWFEGTAQVDTSPSIAVTGRAPWRLVMAADALGDLPESRRELHFLDDSLPTRQPRLSLCGEDVTVAALNQAADTEDGTVLLHLSTRVSMGSSYGPQLVLRNNALSAHNLRMASSGCLWAFLHLAPSAEATQSAVQMTDSFAAALLEEGVRGVAASLGPRFTSGSRQIMADYYRFVFDGEPPAQALLHARQEFLARNPQDPAWAFFVFYGDPSDSDSLRAELGERDLSAPVQRPLEPAATGSWTGTKSEPALTGASAQAEAQNAMESALAGDGSLEYDFDLEQAIGIALMEAKNLRQDFIGTPHLFIGLTKCPGGVTRALLESSGFDPKKVRDTIRYALGFGHAPLDAKILPTQRCARALKTAENNARQANDTVVREQHLLAAILQSGEGLAFEVLKKMGADPQKLYDKLNKGDSLEQPGLNPQNTPTIDRYGRDLTALAKEGKLPPLTGRSSELLRLAQILLRRFKNNPLLIGEAGVGKTALIEGLAQRISSGLIPEELRDRRLIELSLSSLVAGTRYRGDFEERLTQVLREARENPNIVLFLDEFHTIVGAGETHQGTLDAANILKPALARGELRCIGATTPVEYRKYIEKDAALERRFHPLFLEEPSVEESVLILEGSRAGYEEHHNVEIPTETLSKAVELSVRYLRNRCLPDKALDLLDEACALMTLRGHRAALLGKEIEEQPENTKPVVREEAIYEVLSDRTGIPVGEIGREESMRLLDLPKKLSDRVLGQPRAISSISQAIQLGRAGLKHENQPTAVLLFLGPSGVGKTELCRCVAKELFGDESALIRLDMSEFAEKHSSAKLLGAPPGYVGHGEDGQLLSQLHHRPYSVVLLDEIDKAHPEILDVFLQLFEEGRLTDSLSRTVDGRHAVFVMTSNLLADKLSQRKRLGFQQAGDDQSVPQKEIVNDLKRHFRPEFFNRIDECVVFDPLSEETLLNIAKLRFEELSQRALKQGVLLGTDLDALCVLVAGANDPGLGARPLLRAIEQQISRPLSRLLLSDAAKHNDNVPRGQIRMQARLQLIDGEPTLCASGQTYTPPALNSLRELETSEG